MPAQRQLSHPSEISQGRGVKARYNSRVFRRGPLTYCGSAEPSRQSLWEIASISVHPNQYQQHRQSLPRILVEACLRLKSSAIMRQSA
jgi:hypothetical protein